MIPECQVSLTHRNTNQASHIQNLQTAGKLILAMPVAGGRPTGAVRVSFGYMSTLADADAVIALVRNFFVEACNPTGHECSTAGKGTAAAHAAGCPSSGHTHVPAFTTPLCQADGAAIDRTAMAVVGTAEALPVAHPESQAATAAEALAGATAATTATPATAVRDSMLAPLQLGGADVHITGSGPRLTGLWVFPVKSAAGISVQQWPLGPNGLYLDRCDALSAPSEPMA